MQGIDVNQMTAEQLVQMSGIGLETARAIVRHREEHGPIKSWDELRAILDEVELVPSDERSAISFGSGPSARADGADETVRLERTKTTARTR
jgi:hypothetical protein